MKKIIALFSLLLVAGYFYSKELTTNDTTEVIKTEELESAEVAEEYKASMEGWIVGLEKAYEESKRTGKPILANFTGSTWCGWCIKLKRDVFTKPKFKTWANENVILFEVDFPRGMIEIPENIQRENDALQREFEIQGFPTVWFMNLDKVEGKYSIGALGKLSYQQNEDIFISKANQILAGNK